MIRSTAWVDAQRLSATAPADRGLGPKLLQKQPFSSRFGPLVTPGLVSFAHLARRFEDGCGGTEILREISHTILQTSSTPVHLEESLIAAQSPKLYHDAKCMRLESIGLLCATAGRLSKQRFGDSEKGRETFYYHYDAVQ